MVGTKYPSGSSVGDVPVIYGFFNYISCMGTRTRHASTFSCFFFQYEFMFFMASQSKRKRHNDNGNIACRV